MNSSNINNPVWGHCPQCKEANHYRTWCLSSDQEALVAKFNSWSTGDKGLDLFIQETQRTARDYMTYLEYVPYDRFTKVKPLAKGGSFADVFTATWLDGKRQVIRGGTTKGRSNPFTVVLKMINDSTNVDQSFIDRLRLYYQFYKKNGCGGLCQFYGITRDPSTKNYALILHYFPDGSLRKRLTKRKSRLTWRGKLRQIYLVCTNLKAIHGEDYIHRRIHSGNIILDGLNAWLIDFGLAQPESPEHAGIIPYMAPELLRGEPHSRETDIYAIGIVLSEYASGELAFSDRDHDTLRREIINGLRPRVPPGTPKCYKELMDRCLSEDPSNRPTAEDLCDSFYKWWGYLEDDVGNATEAKQFKIADQEGKPIKTKTKSSWWCCTFNANRFLCVRK